MDKTLLQQKTENSLQLKVVIHPLKQILSSVKEQTNASNSIVFQIHTAVQTKKRIPQPKGKFLFYWALSSFLQAAAWG